MLCKTDSGALFRITGWAKFAARGDWYRVACSKAVMENVRGDISKIRLCYNNWNIPDGEEEEQIYETKWESENDKGAIAGHDGSDYFMVKDFIDCVQNDKTPFFDVYRACAMAATGILGWRSCMENGSEYIIPDFKNPEDRKKWKDDNISPFPDDDGNVSMPCSIYSNNN